MANYGKLRRLIDKLPAPAPRLIRHGYRSMRTFGPSITGLTPKGAIAMLHVGRSGSTVIGNMLNQHPEIVWDGEIYHTSHYALGLDLSMGRYADWTCRQFTLGAPGYYGFECKILPGQHLGFLDVALEPYLEKLQEIGVTHFVILERRNILRRMVSQYVGSKSQKRHIAAGGRAILNKIELPVTACRFGDSPEQKTLLACMEEVEVAYETSKAKLAAANFITLVYEEDVDGVKGPTQAVGKICDLIGVETPAGSPDLSKTNPFLLNDILSNFDEVAVHLSNTRYAWMLDE